MATKEQNEAKVTTINLTDEQRAAIQQATGVSLKELSLIEQVGAAAREINLNLLKSVTVVMCW